MNYWNPKYDEDLIPLQISVRIIYYIILQSFQLNISLISNLVLKNFKWINKLDNQKMQNWQISHSLKLCQLLIYLSKLKIIQILKNSYLKKYK